MRALNKLLLAWSVTILSNCSSSVDDSDSFTEVTEVSPLDTMATGGPTRRVEAVAEMGSGFITGDTVEVAAANTPLFVKYPKSGATPSQLLSAGTVLEVVASKGKYIQVSGDSGLSGFVPDVMVVPQGVIDSLPPESTEVANEDEADSGESEAPEEDTTVEVQEKEEVVSAESPAE
jgi:hypothetical protein